LVFLYRECHVEQSACFIEPEHPAFPVEFG